MKKNRNLGIELLRIISMFMILISHFSFHCISKNFELNFAQKIFFDSILFGNIGVVIFLIISGYFYNTKFKIKKLIKFILCTQFYSIFLYILSSYNNVFSIKDFIMSFFPINSNLYWFMTSFIIIYIISPFISKFLGSLKEKEFKYFLVIYFFLFISHDFILKYIFSFTPSNDIIELLFYYSIGAYINKYESSFNKKIRIRYIFYSYFIIVLSIVIMNNFHFNNSTILLARSSIFVIYIGISLFILLKKINIKGNSILFFSNNCLAVYLVHDNKYFRLILWSKIIKYMPSNIFLNIIYIIIILLLIYIICILIDKLREKIENILFRKLKFIDDIDDKISIL